MIFVKQNTQWIKIQTSDSQKRLVVLFPVARFMTLSETVLPTSTVAPSASSNSIPSFFTVSSVGVCSPVSGFVPSSLLSPPWHAVKETSSAASRSIIKSIFFIMIILQTFTRLKYVHFYYYIIASSNYFFNHYLKQKRTIYKIFC